MCGIVGAAQRAQRRTDPDRRHPPARVSRLRLLGAVRDRRRGERRCSTGWSVPHASPTLRRRPTGVRWPAPRASRTRAGQRTARLPRTTRTRTPPAARSRWCTTASSRTSRSCATSLKARGYEFVTQTDTEVIAHLVHRDWHARRRRRPAARGAGGGRGVQGRVRDRGDLDPRAGPPRRRARGQPAGRGPRRGRPLPRLRRRGAPPGHAARDLSRGGRSSPTCAGRRSRSTTRAASASIGP